MKFLQKLNRFKILVLAICSFDRIAQVDIEYQTLEHVHEREVIDRKVQEAEYKKNNSYVTLIVKICSCEYLSVVSLFLH